MKKFILSLVCTFSQLSAYTEPLHYITERAEVQKLFPSVQEYEVTDHPQVTRFFIVRHGENEANAKKWIDGRTLDLPLTDKGIQDARNAGKVLVDVAKRIDFFASSPMKRAQQTAREIMHFFGAEELQLDSRYLERNYGDFEGGVEEDYIHCQEIVQKTIPVLETFDERFDFKEHPSVESYKEIYQRFSEGLLELAKEHPGQNVLIASHGGSIRSLFQMGCAEQHNVYFPNFHYKVGNGGIIVIESDGNTLTVKAFSGFRYIP